MILKKQDMSIQENKQKSPYPKGNTALIVVDPFNDFLSKGGLAWPLVKANVKQLRMIEHAESLLNIARQKGIKVVYSPHHHYRKGSHSERKYLHPTHVAQLGYGKIFSQGKWGGDYVERLAPRDGEFVASEHSCSSGFAGTNLHDHLSANDITHLIVIGMVTNSCIEATVRTAVDLDYHVTLVTDAVAAFSPSEHEQATKERYPLLGHIVGSTEAIIQKIKID